MVQRATKLPVLFQSYLLQLMYYDISVPDSFMYTYRYYIGYVPNISRYDS